MDGRFDQAHAGQPCGSKQTRVSGRGVEQGETITVDGATQTLTANGTREALFNATSVMTGTGYASDDYNAWGGFPVALFFIIALVGAAAAP